MTLTVAAFLLLALPASADTTAVPSYATACVCAQFQWGHLTPGTRYKVVYQPYASDDSPPGDTYNIGATADSSGTLRSSIPIWILAYYQNGGEYDASRPVYKIREWAYTGGSENFSTPARDNSGAEMCLEYDVYEPFVKEPCD